MIARRVAWRERMKTTDIFRLAFIDETGAKTNMTRLYARSPKGKRATSFVPRGHWSTTTLVAALTIDGATAPMTLDGAMDRICFEAYVEQALIPALKPGTIVVMDNLSSHKSSKVRTMLEQARMELWFLPPYSPDLNPIELAWSKVKTALRQAKARTRDELDKAIAISLDSITPRESQNFFLHASYPCK